MWSRNTSYIRDCSERYLGHNSENNCGDKEKGMEIEWAGFAQGVCAGYAEEHVST